MLNFNRFWLFLLILLVAIGIQIRSLELLGWSIDATLVVLLIFAFWATIAEELLLIITAALLLSWRPGIPSELIVFILAPIILFLTRSLFPWRRGITAAIFIILSVTILYGMYAGYAIIRQGFFWKDLAASFVLGGALFLFLKDRYQAFRTAGRSPFYALPR